MDASWLDRVSGALLYVAECISSIVDIIGALDLLSLPIWILWSIAQIVWLVLARH
jgi:hypothetical protein